MLYSKEVKQITVFSGVVVKNGTVLMSLRDEEECKDAHMKWEFPGGKCDFGETPQEAVKREFLEETGVEIEVIKLLSYVATNYWKYEWGTQQTLCFVFLCQFKRQREVQKDHHVASIEWIDIEKAKTISSLPGTKEVLEIVEQTLA